MLVLRERKGGGDFWATCWLEEEVQERQESTSVFAQIRAWVMWVITLLIHPCMTMVVCPLLVDEMREEIVCTAFFSATVCGHV